VRLRDSVCYITGTPLDADLYSIPPTWAYLVAIVRFSSIARPNYEWIWTSIGLTLIPVIMRPSFPPHMRA
jgi:hypothetical protein